MSSLEPKLYIETPLIYSEKLSMLLNSRVYLKIEALQPSCSFKNRGIGYFCEQKIKEGAKQFISSSGGNAGLAASFAARKLGIPILVVLPLSTPQMMVDKIKAEGASIIQKGADWQEADQYARELCSEQKACYVPPFDDPAIWTGNATVIHEAAKTGLKPDAVVLSVGGGGLFCGVVQGMHDVGWNEVPVYAVETVGAASFAAAITAGRVVAIESIETIAKSLGARAVCQQALEWTKSHLVFSKVVSDSSAVKACLRFSEDHQLFVEPACGASLSLCYDQDPDLMNDKTILVIVCGGAAVTPKMIHDWAGYYSR